MTVELLTIKADDGELLVRIDSDGSMTFGENYEPDEAAKTFWAAFSHHAPGVLA